MVKRIIVQVDNHIRDVRQPIASAKKQRDNAVFDAPAAGGSGTLDGAGPGNAGAGFLSDGSWDGYFGASGDPICVPYSKQPSTLTKSGSLYVYDGDGTVGDVFFDHLLAVKDDHYTLSNNQVTPVTSLVNGTTVTARIRPA